MLSLKKFYGILLVFILAVCINSGWGYYYSTNFGAGFNAAASGWTANLNYSMDAGIKAEGLANTVTFSAVGAAFSGKVVTAAANYEQLKGNMLRYDTSYQASYDQPFGYEITRTLARLDPNDDTSNPESGRMWNSFSIWLAQYKAGIVNASAGAKYDNSFNFMEFYRPRLATQSDTEPFSYWGNNDNKVGGYFFTAVTNTAGDIQNLTSFLSWCYDNTWGMNSQNATATPGTINAYPDNNNIIRVRVNTDGEYVYLYINPNPDSLATQRTNAGNVNISNPNSFYLIAKEPIAFSNNLIAMFGVEANRQDGQSQNITIRDFTIRSICSNLTTEIIPAEMRAGGTSPLNIIIKPLFSVVNEAGIGEVSIDMPLGYTWMDAGVTNNMTLRWIDTNTGASVKTFSINYGNDVSPSAGTAQVIIKDTEINGDKRRIKIRFNPADYFHPDNMGGSLATANSRAILLVISNFTALSTADSTGKTFGIWANNEKYSDITWAKTATTGIMKSLPGNTVSGILLSQSSDLNTLTLKTYNDQRGVGALRPNFMYEGEQKTFFYDIAASNENNSAYISSNVIQLPIGFTIDANTLASERLTNFGNMIYNAAQRTITVNYAAEGKKLVAGSGFDTIWFNNLTTTNLDSVGSNGTNELRSYVVSYSYSALAGTGVFSNVTSDLYPQQSFLIRKKPPKGSAWISPNEISNTTLSNMYQYTVANTAVNTGNNIRKVLIGLNSNINRVRGISSGVPSVISITTNITNNNITNGSGKVWIVVDYSGAGTNLQKGSEDTIQFWGDDIAASLSDDVDGDNTSYADNGNGDGWAVLTEDVGGWKIKYYTPPANGRGYILYPQNEDNEADVYHNHHIYTDNEGYTNMMLRIKNWGEAENDISRIKIECPGVITNVNQVYSAKASNNVYINGNGNYEIELFYTNLLKAGNSGAAEFDDIQISMAFNETNVVETNFNLWVKNTTNYTKASSEAFDNLNIRFIYPKAQAEGWVEVVNGFIDASTNEALIMYHVSNTGSVRNKLREVRVMLPSDIFTNVEFMGSSLGGQNGGVMYGVPYNQLRIVNYTNFDGGSNDTINIKVGIKETTPGNVEIPLGVSNIRWLTNGINITGGKSQSVAIIPPPTFYSYGISPNLVYIADTNISGLVTNTVVMTISNRGWGNNGINKVKIDIPQPLGTNELVNVNSLLMNKDLSNSGGLISLSNGNEIWLNYDLGYNGTQSNIDVGEKDLISLTIRYSNIVTNVYWSVSAANEYATNVSGQYIFTNYWAGQYPVGSGTNLMSIIDYPYGWVTPNEVNAPSDKNFYSNYIKNGNANTGRPIKKLRIYYNDAANIYTSIQISNYSGVSNITTNDGYMDVDYALGLQAKNNDTITYWGTDRWLEGETTAAMQMKVQYDADEGNWHNVRSGSGSMNVHFLNPVVNGRAYATPNIVPQDFPSYDYEFNVRNEGEIGNNIQIVKIMAPSFITNITGVLSVVKGAPAFITNINGTNTMWLYYTNSFVMNSGDTDVVRFTGYDGLWPTNIVSTSWVVKVDNTVSNTAEKDATAADGKSLGVSVLRPAYSTSVYVEATNYVSSMQRNSIYTSETNNYLKFKVYNQSTTGNNLTKLRILIPDIGTLLVTNGIKVTNQSYSNVSMAASNGYIWADYSGQKIAAGDGDVIFVQMSDMVAHLETNVSYQAEVAFDSTYNLYKPAAPFPGFTMNINYEMPLPSVVESLTPSRLYQSKKWFDIDLKVTNTGKGTSDVDEMYISLPSDFRNGFSLNRLSGTSAVSTNYNAGSGVITLGYGSAGLLAGNCDIIHLSLTNTSTNSGVETIDVSARNFVKTNQAGGSGDIFLSTAPTLYVTPNVIDTTARNGNFQIYINNDINSDTAISNVVLEFSTLFTNVLPISSMVLTNIGDIGGVASSITLSYAKENKAIDSGNYDMVELKLQDNMETGNYITGIRGYVSDGFGYVPLELKNQKSTNIDFVMPQTVSENRINPETIVLTTINNQMNVTILNNATGSGKISFAQIKMPDLITNLLNVVSSNGTAVYNPAGNMIQVSYTNEGLLETNSADVVRFDYQNLANMVTNLVFRVQTANLTNNEVYYEAPGKNGQNSILKVSYPPLAVESYFSGENNLYLIETNAALNYRLLNRTYDTMITQTVLTMSTNPFNTITVSNSKAANVTYDYPNGKITLAYNPGAMKYLDYDDIQLLFNYNLTNIGYVGIGTKVWIIPSASGGTNYAGLDTITSGGNPTNIGITNSNWGIVKGKVFPNLKTVNVKVYDPATKAKAKDSQGKEMGTVTVQGSGDYVLNRVLSGNYDLEFSAPSYRTLLQNINVLANQISTISIITMRNAPMVAGGGGQTVDSFEVSNTKIEFPGNALDRAFSINIRYVSMTDGQKKNAGDNKKVKKPGSSDLYGYYLELNDENDKAIEGAVLNQDAVITLAYSTSNLSENGWSESELAMYYWDEIGDQSRWIRVGGTVDMVNQTVSAKVSYIHRYYAVMGKADDGNSGVIRNVAVRPKVFTPTKGEDGYFGTVRISFELDPTQKFDGYEVKIYDIRGNLLRDFKRSGNYTQGEISWDSKDTEGYEVKSGIYIYRVIAGSNVYSGSIVIAR